MNELNLVIGKKILDYKLTSDSLTIFVSGRKVHFYHTQDCCEHVRITDHTPLDPMVGLRITDIQLSQSQDPEYETYDSYTWNYLTIICEDQKNQNHEFKVTWLGESNGCYSETVDFLVEDTLT